MGVGQLRLGRALGCKRGSNLSQAIAEWLLAEHERGAAIPLTPLGMVEQGDQRKAVIRTLLTKKYGPSGPKIPDRLQAWARPASRIFDPDEATAPRDVWMTFYPGPDPRLNFMEPVR